MDRQQILKEIQDQSKSKFSQLRTQALQEAVRNLSAAAAAAGDSSSGGGRTPSLEFVVNTTDNLEFGFNFTSTGEPIAFTINWGDGTIHEDSGGGGYYEESHEYAEVGEYTVTVTFDDPLKILELDFPGSSNDYAGISSITNLQYLSNLQDFRADNNHLESVDLSGLTNLTYVDISDCELPDSNTHSLTSVNLSGCTALEELRLDDSDFSGGFPNLSGLNSLFYFDADQCDIVGTVDLSGLPSLNGFDLNGNSQLTRVIISSSQPLGDGWSIYIYGCGLTQTAVDNILVALSTNGVLNGSIDMEGGTNATPSATGLAAKSVLEGNGWEVLVN